MVKLRVVLPQAQLSILRKVEETKDLLDGAVALFLPHQSCPFYCVQFLSSKTINIFK